MKKLIAILLSLACGVALADRNGVELRKEFIAEYSTNKVNIATWYDGVSESEWRGFADWCVSVAVTNRTLAGFYIYAPNVINYMSTSADTKFIAEYDQKLSAAGLGAGFPSLYDKLPKLVEHWISDPSNAV